MAMTTDKLAAGGDVANCPFDGALAHITEDTYGVWPGGPAYRVECLNCHAMTCYWHRKEEALAAWNRRAGEGSQAAPLPCGHDRKFWHNFGESTHPATGAKFPETWACALCQIASMAAAAGSGTFAAHLDMETVAWAINCLVEQGMPESDANKYVRGSEELAKLIKLAQEKREPAPAPQCKCESISVEAGDATWPDTDTTKCPMHGRPRQVRRKVDEPQTPHNCL